MTLDASAFSVYEPSAPEMMPLLYQTGYLTIKSSMREGVYEQYTLGFPNDEVRNAFSKAVSRKFSALSAAGVAFDAEMRNLSDRKIEVVAE